MRFTKVPDDLPSPQSFLRAGIPRPTSLASGVPIPRIVESGDGPSPAEAASEQPADPATITVDAEGLPSGARFERSGRYLIRPFHKKWTGKEIKSVTRNPTGVMHMTVGREPDSKVPPQPDPLDPATCRVVTFDRSVLLAGLEPTLFGADDALFISAALHLDAAVTTNRRSDDHRDRGTAFFYWYETEPVPVDPYVVRIYQWLCNSESGARVLWRDDPLDRTDLLCAATAILYDAPLYTTDKTAYQGIRGLRTLQYGRRRSKPRPHKPYKMFD